MSSDVLIWQGATGRDIGIDRTLRTAVILSLDCDRRAEPGDLPAGENPRGWWADDELELAGDRWGSRLWLLRSGKRLDSTLRRAEYYAREALDWMIRREVATRIDATASWRDAGTESVLQLHIEIYQGETAIYQHIWRQTLGY